MLIEIFADIVCPWCYIGRNRLRRALALRPQRPVQIAWRPFQLNPDMAPAGMSRRNFLEAKFGGMERARQIEEVIVQTAAEDDLPLAMDRIQRMPNTAAAHRLILGAERLGRGPALVDALFAAYFRYGQDIGDSGVLQAVASAVGIGSPHARELIDSDADRAAVRQSDSLARKLGILAVPCFVFGSQYAISGAQEPGAFLPLLDVEPPEALLASSALMQMR